MKRTILLLCLMTVAALTAGLKAQKLLKVSPHFRMESEDGTSCNGNVPSAPKMEGTGYSVQPITSGNVDPDVFDYTEEVVTSIERPEAGQGISVSAMWDGLADVISIRFSQAAGPVSIDLFDVTGRRLLSTNAVSDGTTLRLRASMPVGVCILAIHKQGSELLYSGKILKSFNR